MNILIEGGDLNPPFFEGTKNITRTYFEELKNRGHNIIVLTKRKGIIDKKKHKKVEIINGVKYYRWSNFLDLFFVYRNIIRFEKIDLIHIFAKGIRPAKYLSFLKHNTSAPIVFSLLGYPFWEEEDTIKFKKFLSNLDQLVVTSKTVFDYLKKFKSNKIIYLPYGVDTSKFKKSTNSSKKKTILCWKRPSKELLDAYKTLEEKNKNIQFILHKNTNYVSQENFNYIKKINLKNVKFIGYGDVAHAYDVLKISDIVVELHKQRGFLDSASPPLFLLEAMSSQKTLVVSDIPEMKEVIQNGKNGYLMNNDYRSIYSTLLKAINAKKTISLNARNSVLNKYDIRKIVPQYEKLYSNLLKN